MQALPVIMAVMTRMFKLALDAGHGINTAGKRCLKSLDSKETREWTLNSRIANYIEEYLKEYEGYEVLRLDDKDDGKTDIPLATRTTKANSWGADFYLSVHHNAGLNGGSGGGITIFTHPNAKGAAVEWRNELYDSLIKHTGLKGNRASPKGTYNFHVLRETKMPAVLVELGFMDSKTDVPIILKDDHARACAKAIVETIVKRGGLKKKTVSTVTTSKKLYRVQVGAFAEKSNAEKLAKELTAKGYPTIIKAD